ncbi:MAG: DMT family transporter [Candidatus Nanopelagicales bacterium]|nr:DMT family transporter [Candidatus Nanopelagicales bacterium]
MPALLALLSSVMWGSADYLAGKLSRRRHVLVVLGGTQVVGLVAMLLIATLSGSWGAPGEYAGWAILASLSGASGLALYYRALAIGTMGVVSPIAALGVVVPLAVGLLSGERPSTVQLLGIGLALAGVVAASGPEVRGEAGWRPVLLASGSAVLLGTALVAIAEGSQTSVVMTMTMMRMTTVTLMAIAVVAMRRTVSVSRSEIPSFAAVGLMDVAANLAFGLASTLGMLSLVSVFGSLYPVATILLARFIDHERLRRIQQVGVALALAGVVVITAG